MKEHFNTLLKNKRLALGMVALVALGIFGLVLRRDAPVMPQVDNYANHMELQANNPNYHGHNHLQFLEEQALEARLEEFFSLIEGAGRVRVMISPLTGRETVFAVDVNSSQSSSKEQDAQGGMRETQQYQSQQQTVVITDRQGTDRPLVVREIDAQISGIAIIAEGGDNPFVRDALNRAARAMLGLEPHMIQVLTGSFTD